MAPTPDRGVAATSRRGTTSCPDRAWAATGLTTAVAAGDFLEFRSVNPTWVTTNPANCLFSGAVFITQP